MTTIAFKDGILAADSRGTQGNLISFNDFDKVRRFNSDIFGDVFIAFAGAVNHIAEAQSFIEASFEGRDPDGVRFDAEQMQMLMVDEEGYAYEGMLTEASTDIAWLTLEAPCAIGSGSHIAIGAMDAGLSAEGAVNAAIKRDCYSGGAVKTYNCKELSYVSKLKLQKKAIEDKLRAIEDAEDLPDVVDKDDGGGIWLTNTGVEPSKCESYVEVEFEDGGLDYGTVVSYNWDLEDPHLHDEGVVIRRWRYCEEEA